MSHSKLKKSSKVIIVTLSVVAIIGSAVAWKFHGGIERHSERWVNHMQSEFNLNSQQTRSLDELKDLLIDLGREAKESRKQQVTKIVDLVLAEELNQEQALAMVEETTSVIEDKASTVIIALANFSDQLSLDQKLEMRNKIEHKMARWN